MMNFNGNERKINDTYAEINLKRLRKNFELVKKYSNKDPRRTIRVCSIVKADAYGHGMCEVAEVLVKSGTDYLGTADYSESIKLSDHLKKFSKKKVPVLCLGLLTDEKFFGDVISRNIEVSIADIKSAEKLHDYAKSVNKKVSVQMQIDSGINRTGFKIKDTFEAVRKLKQSENFEITGIYSHFATSEISKNNYALKQLEDFKSLIRELELNSMKLGLKHICNTGGILNYNDPFFNMVRPGISLYGYYPDRKKLVKDIGIKPVMTLRSKVKFIKTLDKGQSISYGRKYFTKSETLIASLPLGYGDGYPRLLTNRAKVYIKGKLYPVVGTVCMDWIMVNIGNSSSIKVNDEVEIFGSRYAADNLSEMIGTIPYEITCNVTKRVERVYTNN
ncbi:MAG: alanine racemase [Ignavibacteria bacterium]